MKKLILIILSSLVLGSCDITTSKSYPLIISSTTTTSSNKETRGIYTYTIEGFKSDLIIHSDSIWSAGDTLILSKKR